MWEFLVTPINLCGYGRISISIKLLAADGTKVSGINKSKNTNAPSTRESNILSIVSTLLYSGDMNAQMILINNPNKPMITADIITYETTVLASISPKDLFSAKSENPVTDAIDPAILSHSLHRFLSFILKASHHILN